MQLSGLGSLTFKFGLVGQSAFVDHRDGPVYFLFSRDGYGVFHLALWFKAQFYVHRKMVGVYILPSSINESISL